jgi:phosphonoacetaldehyde hydrolase
LTKDELAALSSGERDKIRQAVGADLRRAGAHATIDTVADLMPTLAEIGARIQAGEKP